jgi:D-galactonate transporter
MGVADATVPKVKTAAAAGTLIRSNYRWVICGLICLMSLILFMDRTNISIAAPFIIKEFGLSKTEMGLVFSTFAWAYAIGNIPGGWLGDRYGPRLMLCLMVAFWSLMTMATAHAIGLISLLIIRFVFGLGEAGAWPTATRAMQYWYPKSERGFVNGATHSAALLATSVVPLVSVTIIDMFGWRSLFHIFGLLGVFWGVLWYFMYRNRPEQHKSVSEAELAHIRGDLDDHENAANAKPSAAKVVVPWKTILRSPNLWFLAFSYVAFNYTSYFFYYWMPTYLVEHHHISLKAMGVLASLPLAAGAIGSLSGGVLTDFVYRRTKNLKWSRRAVCIGAMIGAAVFIIPAGIASSPYVVVAFLSLSIFSVTFVLAPVWAVSMDISGGYSGSVSGVVNMVGQAGGSISPIVFGALAQNGYWVAPFYITAAVLVAAAAMWAFLINPERSVLDR